MTTYPQPIAELLRARYHGAANISGIWYQLRYSLLRAFELYSARESRFQFEGLEDGDLRGVAIGTEYIQVKWSRDGHAWKKALAEPLQSFLAAYRADSSCRLTLALSYPPKADLAKLASLASLSEDQRAKVAHKFKSLCAEIGATRAESEGMLKVFRIDFRPPPRLDEELRRAVHAQWQPEASPDLYVGALLAASLNWAANRSTVSADELDELRRKIGEAMAVETGLAARAAGLVAPIRWDPDGSPDAFRTARGTRPGHIALDLDVPRTAWLARIQAALRKAGTVALRGPSGIGKSALALRALRAYPDHQAIAIQPVSAAADVELIREYLEVRCQLGNRPAVFFDDAGASGVHWSRVVEQCAALQLPVLVTISEESWRAAGGLTGADFELLEPTLDEDEARSIHQGLVSSGHCHPDAQDFEWAWEQLGAPPLLAEFIHLVTQGDSLKARLDKQLARQTTGPDERATRDAIRRVSLAHVLGTKLDCEKLVASVAPQGDPQRFIDSLASEFASVDNGFVTGLHGVRSRHLVELLHGSYQDKTRTAIQVLGCLRPEDITTLAANLQGDIRLEEVFREAQTRLVRPTQHAELLRAAFVAGEEAYFQRLKPLFDRMYGRSKGGGLFIAALYFGPNDPLHTLDALKALDGMAALIAELEEWQKKAASWTRGADLCGMLLDNQPLTAFGSQGLATRQELEEAAALLDMYAYCERMPRDWTDTSAALLASHAWTSLPPETLGTLLLAIWRLDPTAHAAWMSAWGNELADWMHFGLKCTQVTLSTESVHLEVLASDEDDNAASDRLQLARSMLPHLQSYESDGVYLLPMGVKPSVDNFHKRIPAANLFFSVDVARNVRWRHLIESHYLPDGHYSLQRLWHDYRQHVLQFCRGAARCMECLLRQGHFEPAPREPWDFVANPGNAPPSLASFGRRAQNRLRSFVHEPRDASAEADSWAADICFSVMNAAKSLADEENARSRLVHQLRGSVKKLEGMHNEFEREFVRAPDYFGCERLRAVEREAHRDLLQAAELLRDGAKLKPTESLESASTRNRASREKRIVEILKGHVAALGHDSAVRVGLVGLVREDLRYGFLAIQVSDPWLPVEALTVAATVLCAAEDEVDFVYVVPVQGSTAIMNRCYLIGSIRAREIVEAPEDIQWETQAGVAPPAELSSAPHLRCGQASCGGFG